MNRAQKESFVSDLGKGIKDAQAFVLMSFTKMSVEQMTAFRLGLRKKNVHVRVIKNTLAKRALGLTPYKEMNAQLQGPNLIAYGSGDPVVTAKAVMEWVGKENFNLKVRSSAALGQVLSESQLKTLSNLPGRKELLVSFLWALNMHPTSFLYALQNAPKRLGYALVALKEKREKATSN